MPPDIGRSGRPEEAGLRRACAELERRLADGEPRAAEDLFAAFPALASDAEAALELIYTEFVARERLGQRPEPADYYARFPQRRRDLEQLFQVHHAVAAGSARDPADAANTSRLDPGRPAVAAGAAGGAGPARRFGDYELLEEVGRGGMGVVYKARQAGLNRVVALKTILAGEFAGPADLTRFRAEAKAAARLQHPNVVQIHEVGEHDGRPYFSLEYVDGGSLEAKLNGAPWPAREAAALVEVLARAMHYAHQRGVVHRDLKPANILLAAGAPAAVPKITDFGLARRVPAADGGTTAPPGPTRSGAVLGTPGYMAPEQAAGQGREVGPAADVYALGAILYELLTGRPPFRGVNALETLEQVLTREPAPPARLQPSVPRDLETVCLKCLQKEPNKRYTSAEALADDLRRFLAGEPVRAKPTPAWERAAKWAKRRPAVAALLAAVVAVAAVGAAGVAWSWRQTLDALDQAERGRDRERILKERAEAALAQKTVALARQAWLADDLEEARRHLDEVGPAYRDWDWRYLHRVCHAELLSLRGGEPNASKMAWSPDGRCLAVASSGIAGVSLQHPVTVWDTESGQTRWTVGFPHFVDALAFTPDERQLVAAGHSSTFIGAPSKGVPWVMVKVWDPGNGKEVQTWRRDAAAKLGTLSRDGRHVAILLQGSWSVQFSEVAPGQEFRTLPGTSGPSDSYRLALNADGRLLATADSQAVRVWDTATGEATGPSLPIAAGRCGWVVFSPDGRLLAYFLQEASKDTGLVTVWDVRGGREVMALRGRTDTLNCAAFSPDGRRLASGSSNKTVRLWDVASGKELLTFRGHTASVNSVEFSPDGARLASGAADGAIKIWEARPLEDPPE
jgi:hypothetical protein